jgi:hypothetical protein
MTPNKAFEQTPRERGVLSSRDGRSSTPGTLGTSHHRLEANVDSSSQDPRSKIEYWPEHAAVPRPPEPKPSLWPLLVMLGLSLFVGLLALGGLALGAHLGHAPRVLSLGVSIIAAGGFLLAAGLGSSRSLGLGLRSSSGPLVTPALVVLAFAAPSIVFVAVAIAVSL